MFAAVNGNVIHIYSVTSFENILNLKGHNGKVSQAGECIRCGRSGSNTLHSCARRERVVIFVKQFCSRNYSTQQFLSFAGVWHSMEPGRQPAGVLWDGWCSVRVEHTHRQAWIWVRPQVLQLHRGCLLFRLQDHPGCGNRPHSEGDPRLSGQ